MSNWIIALFAALGASVWLYTVMMRKTGGNTRSTLVMVAIAGILFFVFCLIALDLIIK